MPITAALSRTTLTLAMTTALIPQCLQAASLRAKGLGEAMASIAGATGSWQYNPAGTKSKVAADTFDVELSLEYLASANSATGSEALQGSSFDILVDSSHIAASYHYSTQEIPTNHNVRDEESGTSNLTTFGANFSFQLNNHHYFGFGLFGNELNEHGQAISEDPLSFSVGYQKRWQNQFSTSSHSTMLIDWALGTSYYSASKSNDNNVGNITPESLSIGGSAALNFVSSKHYYQTLLVSTDLNQQGDSYLLSNETLRLLKSGIEWQLTHSEHWSFALRTGIQFADGTPKKTLMSYGATINYGSHHVDIAYWQPYNVIFDNYKLGLGYTGRF